jgi:protein arginine kinase activator
VNDPTGFSLADLLLGLGASQEMEQASGGGEVKCPNCGFTQADFKKAGRLGCSECYQTFSEGLEGLLKTMHKGTRHVGKVPHSQQQARELSDRLKSLQKKLDKAVADENFEQAAQMRRGTAIGFPNGEFSARIKFCDRNGDGRADQYQQDGVMRVA